MNRTLLLEKAESWLFKAAHLAGEGVKAGAKFVKDTPQDIKTMRRTSSLLKNPRLTGQHVVNQHLARELPHIIHSTTKILQDRKVSPPKIAERLAHLRDLQQGVEARTQRLGRLRQDLGQRRNIAVRNNALRLGGAAILATAGSYAYRTYKLRKRQAQEKAQYRKYDIYPQHEYATAPVQPENRAVYYGEEPPNPNRSGPPRVEEARTELINRLIEVFHS